MEPEQVNPPSVEALAPTPSAVMAEKPKPVEIDLEDFEALIGPETEGDDGPKPISQRKIGDLKVLATDTVDEAAAKTAAQQALKKQADTIRSAPEISEAFGISELVLLLASTITRATTGADSILIDQRDLRSKRKNARRRPNPTGRGLKKPHAELQFLIWRCLPAELRRPRTQIELAVNLGVTQKTLSCWAAKPINQKAIQAGQTDVIRTKVGEYCRSAYPAVMRGMVKAAIGGDVAAADRVAREAFNEAPPPQASVSLSIAQIVTQDRQQKKLPSWLAEAEDAGAL